MSALLHLADAWARLADQYIADAWHCLDRMPPISPPPGEMWSAADCMDHYGHRAALREEAARLHGMGATYRSCAESLRREVDHVRALNDGDERICAGCGVLPTAYGDTFCPGCRSALAHGSDPADWAPAEVG